MSGKRFDKGKLRYDLVPFDALEEVVKVLMAGAEKYGDKNWELGMPWSKVFTPAQRHLASILKGEDYDKEDGLLHAAHLACNALFLIRYYKQHPGYDDRDHAYYSHPRIGLDIDDVLADWCATWSEHYDIPIPNNWHFDRFIAEKFEEKKDDFDFWMSIKPKVTDLKFEPTCYVTSRPIPNEWSQLWIDANGFPQAPVFTTNDKTIVKDLCDIFVDDRFSTFVKLNKAGICCFLMDAPHNQKYDVGFKRLFNLNDLL